MTELWHEEFKRCFAEDCPDISLLLFDETGSTNEDAKKYAKEHGTEAVIIARRQTAGKGRLGRRFDSECGGLYLSYLHYPDASFEDAVMLTVYAAVALCLTIEELVPSAHPEIKWVNDVRLGGRKLAGILAEGAISGNDRFDYAVTGIGVNLYRREFPEELRSIATDLETESGVKVSAARLASRLTSRLMKFPTANKQEYLDEYRRRSCVIGKRVTVLSPDGTYEATALEITDRGELRVALDNGNTKDLFTGEISIKI